MKTILWDEHNEGKRIEGLPLRKSKNTTDIWFYLFDDEYATYLLYHNVEI